MHFPEELTIKSFGSGYGGNALLGKKCHALRIASLPGAQRRLAGRAHADRRHRESAGRNALHRRGVPDRLRQDQPGHADPAGGLSRGRLEGLDDRRRHLLDAPGRRRPPVCDQSGSRLLRRGAGHQSARPIRTRWRCSSTTRSSPTSALTADNQPWWEGIDDGAAGHRLAGPTLRHGQAARPRIRIRASPSSARQCPSYSPMAEDPAGRADRAIVFGGRRESLVPLVFEARDWTHGVLVGAAMGSETTAAATGAVGVMRRDPMAMKPFCGYNFADYFAHWLSFDKAGAKLPKIFHVNWFRKGERRQVPVAGLRRQPARAGVDHQARRGQRASSTRRSASCRSRPTSTPQGSISSPPCSSNCSRSTAKAGVPRSRRSANTCRATARVRRPA